MSNKRLIVALDTNNLSKAKEIVSHLNPEQCMVKVGLELFISQREKILDKKSFAFFGKNPSLFNGF